MNNISFMTGSWKKSMHMPMPHEHGAWVMLYIPAILMLWKIRHAPLIPLLLIFAMITAAFIGRHTAELILRNRGSSTGLLWTVIFGGITLGTFLTLTFGYHRYALFEVTAAVICLFILHSLLSTFSPRKRYDRTVWGEWMGSAALALTAPAVQVSLTGTLNAQSWLIALYCWLFFGSGIFHVKMYLQAIRMKGEFQWRQRWIAARSNAIYHIFMIACIILLIIISTKKTEMPLFLAFAPVVLRAIYGIGTLTNNVPQFKRLGMVETIFAFWFICFLSIANY
jgi:hypothetical protein